MCYDLDSNGLRSLLLFVMSVTTFNCQFSVSFYLFIYLLDVEITLSVPMSGFFYFSFGRFANSPSYLGWDWELNGALTTTQVKNLTWNPHNLSGGTGIYGIIGKAGLTFPGYNGTITINVYSGSGC